MIAEELVGDGLKGSRNSGGIGHGGLTCSGFTEEMMRRKQVESGRTEGMLPVGSWDVITG